MPPEPDPTSNPGSSRSSWYGPLIVWFFVAFWAAGSLLFLYLGVSWLIAGRTGEAAVALGSLTVLVASAFALARKRRPALVELAGTEAEQSMEPVASPRGVETTPLRRAATLSTHRIKRPGPDVIAITPAPGQLTGTRVLVGVGLLLLAAVAVGVPLGMIVSWPKGLGLFVGGLFLSGIGYVALQGIETHQFDRRAGVFRVSIPKRTEFEIPLRSIRGVQILTDVPREVEGRYTTYRVSIDQLNLVLHPSAGPRRNLIESGDREAILGLGRVLADFLGVALYRDGAALPADLSAHVDRDP